MTPQTNAKTHNTGISTTVIISLFSELVSLASNAKSGLPVSASLVEVLVTVATSQ